MAQSSLVDISARRTGGALWGGRALKLEEVTNKNRREKSLKELELLALV